MTGTTQYVPILKSRLGELTALRHMAVELADFCTPLIELEKADEDSATHEPIGPTRPAAALRKVINRVRNHWNPRFDLMIDAHAFPDTRGGNPTLFVLEDCAEEFVGVIPVVWLSDEDRVLRAIGQEVRRSPHNQPICIRMIGTDLGTYYGPELPRRLEQIVSLVEMPARSVHLVIDLGVVGSEEAVHGCIRAAHRVLLRLPRLQEWKSVTLAGGGFPNDLSGIVPGKFVYLDRWEVACWREVRQLLGEGTRCPSFGDYTIAYPLQSSGVSFRPAPQIRYTVEDAWLVRKGSRSDPRGCAQFLDICSEIVSRAAFTPELTWGDEQIVARAQYGPVDPVPAGAPVGNGRLWRAIGTSHHIGFVAHRIKTVGSP